MTPIEIENLHRSFQGRRAVDGLTLSVDTGEVVALLGRNGAGKSTAIKILLGHLRPTMGRARLLGHDSWSLPPSIRLRVGYMAEGNKLDPWATVQEVVRFTRAHYPAWSDKIAGELIDYFALPLDQRVDRLSNGQRGQLAIALMLAPDPDLLILDDPMLGLDLVVREHFLSALAELLSSRKRSVLFTSHLLEDVERIADRIIIMVDGRSVMEGTLAELQKRVRRFWLRLHGEHSIPENLPGLLTARPEGSGWNIIIKSHDELLKLDAEEIEERPIRLNEIFSAVTTPQGKMKSFPRLDGAP